MPLAHVAVRQCEARSVLAALIGVAEADAPRATLRPRDPVPFNPTYFDVDRDAPQF